MRFDKIRVLEQIRKLLMILKPSEYHIRRSVEKWILFGCKYFYHCENCNYVTCYTRYIDYLKCPYCESKLKFLESIDFEELINYIGKFINRAVVTYENVFSNVIDVFRKYGEFETFRIDIGGIKILKPEIHFSIATKITINFLKPGGTEIFTIEPKHYSYPIEIIEILKNIDDMRLFKVRIVTTRFLEYTNIYEKYGYRYIPPYSFEYIP